MQEGLKLQEIKESAKKYFEEHKEEFDEKLAKLSDDEIQNATGQLISTVSLSDGSVYDRAFWMFFYEDNPST